MRLAEQKGWKVLMLIRDGDAIVESMSAAFQQHIDGEQSEMGTFVLTLTIVAAIMGSMAIGVSSAISVFRARAAGCQMTVLVRTQSMGPRRLRSNPELNWPTGR